MDEHNHITEGKSLFIKLEQIGYMPNAYTQFIKRRFILDNRLLFFEGIVHEDILFYPQTLLSAHRVMSIEDVLYHYRKRGNSITGLVTSDRRYSYYIVLVELLLYWKKNELKLL